MLLQKTNIERELSRIKLKTPTVNTTLDQVRQILEYDDNLESSIEERLNQKSNITSNNFDLDFLETSQIFHIEQIKKICTDYRLRFLNTRYFKGEIPKTAISKIKKLEKEHAKLLEKAMHAQRNGDMALFAKISTEAEEVYQKILKIEADEK